QSAHGPAPARGHPRKSSQASHQGGALMPVPGEIRKSPTLQNVRVSQSRGSLKLQVLSFTAVVVITLVGFLFAFFHIKTQDVLQLQLEQRVKGLARNLANASLYGVI